ncbi:MAG: tetraacyldisaccharide 4'-kinase, partial [Rhodospirillales bacterium]|nr:tetraacyldisaccharide 4'-kinase [Rhodospirillales bacterium]
EPVAAGAARADAAVLVGADRSGALARLPAGLPVLHAALRPDAAQAALAGRRVVAFAGIAIPEKFFASLAEAGAQVMERHSFPDHYRFSGAELDFLAERADLRRAVLVTTPKDAMRLPVAFRRRVRVAGVTLEFADPAALAAMLDRALGPAPRA